MRLARLTLAALLSVGLLTTFSASRVLAADISVNSLADGAIAADGACTLREAITAANADAASGDCPAGSGADAIRFSVSGTITLTSALPDIATDLSISGGGAITISGNGNVRVLLIWGGTVSLLDLTITEGFTSFLGGGVNNSGSLTITNSTITGNMALEVGGGIFNDGTLTLANSTISGNTAFEVGGGIANVGTLTMTNSTISGNSSTATAGGIDNSGTLSITNSTIAANSAGASTGGILALGAETLVNAIVAGNTNGDIFSDVETTTTSLVGVPAGMTLDDILVPAGLADNGGPTQTIALALVAGNPAIGEGDEAACAAAPVNALDQRGLPRPADCDIGAYESQPTLADVADIAVSATSTAGALVNYAVPTATDERGGTADVACLPVSGSTFAVGTTTVTCTATDVAGQTATGTFDVLVGAFVPPGTPALPDTATGSGGSGSSLPIAVLLVATIASAGAWLLGRVRVSRQ